MCSKVKLVSEKVPPVTYAPPHHLLVLVENIEVNVVKEGLVMAKKTKEERETGASDKFENNDKFKLPLVDEIAEIIRSRCARHHAGALLRPSVRLCRQLEDSHAQI